MGTRSRRTSLRAPFQAASLRLLPGLAILALLSLLPAIGVAAIADGDVRAQVDTVGFAAST